MHNSMARRTGDDMAGHRTELKDFTQDEGVTGGVGSVGSVRSLVPAVFDSGPNPQCAITPT